MTLHGRQERHHLILYFPKATGSPTLEHHHIATQCDMFTMFNPEHSHVRGFGEDMGLESMGRGTVSLLTSVDGKPIHTTLQDVLYVPKVTNCLLAIGRIDTKGGMAKFSNGKVTISQTDRRTRMEGKLIRCIYLLDTHAQTSNNTAKIAIEVPKISWLELHR